MKGPLSAAAVALTGMWAGTLPAGHTDLNGGVSAEMDGDRLQDSIVLEAYFYEEDAACGPEVHVTFDVPAGYTHGVLRYAASSDHCTCVSATVGINGAFVGILSEGGTGYVCAGRRSFDVKRNCLSLDIGGCFR